MPPKENLWHYTRDFGGKATLETSVFGENLLNEQLRVAGIDFGPSIGIAGDNYGPPRLFGVEFKVKY